MLKVLGKAFEVELARVDKHASKEDIDLVQVDQLIKQELQTIKTKVAHVVKYDLTEEQRAIVINVLRNCKAISVTTADDLMLMAQGCLTYERCEAMEKAMKKYCPELVKRIKNERAKNTTPAKRIILSKELEKVDLRDLSFNALKNFMCKCCYLEEDINLMATIDLNDHKQALLVQQCCVYVAKTVALPFVMFNDPCYLFFDWQQAFKEVGNKFFIMNTICNQLLEAIEK